MMNAKECEQAERDRSLRDGWMECIDVWIGWMHDLAIFRRNTSGEDEASVAS